ncbi:hypothetical protein D3C78_803660 [compost metagenome]
MQGQLPGAQLLQLPGQHQARQIPVWALAAGDQHLQSWGFEGQELVEPVVQVCGHIDGKIVEYQVDWGYLKGLIASTLAPTVNRVPL